MSGVSERSGYEAFDAKDRNPKRAFVLCRANGETAHLKYTDLHLKRVSADQTAMAIFCYSLNIILYGRNLSRVAYDMDNEFVRLLQEFDPKRWDMPSDPQAPVIERIELWVKAEKAAESLEPLRPLPSRSEHHASH